MTYKVVLTHTEEGYSASCPALPGCWSEGKSEQEALDNIQSAIGEYLEVITEINADKDVREVQVA